MWNLKVYIVLFFTFEVGGDHKIGLVKRTYKDVYSFYTTNCGMS